MHLLPLGCSRSTSPCASPLTLALTHASGGEDGTLASDPRTRAGTSTYGFQVRRRGAHPSCQPAISDSFWWVYPLCGVGVFLAQYQRGSFWIINLVPLE